MRHTYVHVPFCARRCSYCDFAITVARDTPDARFVSAIVAELALRKAQGAWNDELAETLYFGGGTPSRLSADAVADLVAMLTHDGRAPRTAHRAPVLEITLEANPEDVTPEKAAGWKKAGINRVSLGAQSFDPAVLEWMHRTHDAPAIERATRVLRDAGITNLSLDLIFGLPEELAPDVERDLDAILALEPTHLSAYGLSIEPRTPLARWIARGETSHPLDDRYAQAFLAVDQRLRDAGFAHYEVSNYARGGFRSRHNSAYWLGRIYAGLGPAAHSFDGSERRWNIPAWTAYERATRAGADPTAEREALSSEQQEIERLYLGLRTGEGVSRRSVSPNAEPRVAEWEAAGWVEHGGGAVRLTAEGWLRLDEIVSVLTTSLDGG